ncbi:MAG: biotin transporter BioY [Eubacteriales bacterium]
MMKTKELTYGALCTAMMAACSWITIPTATAPFTMQTFAVFFTLFFLGGKDGTRSVLAYLLLGAMGAPVFAGFTGGLGILLGSTGGYLIGFLGIAMLYWMAKPKGEIMSVAVMILGLCLCYLFGTVQFVLLYSANNQGIGLLTGFSWCVLPYIIPDLLKMALAQQLAVRLKPHFKIED